MRTIMAGDVVLDREAARAITELAHLRAASSPSPFPHLSPRELDVDLMAQGLDTHTIARRLIVSPKTVRNHITSIFTKLQVADRAQAIVRAREAGLGREGAI